MKEIVNTPNAPAAIGPYSQAVWGGDLLYSSGQIALDTISGNMLNESIQSETHQVMKNIKGILDAANLNWSHIVKCSIFIKNMNDFQVINELYSSYFEAPYPARETVEVARLPKDARIEISFIAKR